MLLIVSYMVLCFASVLGCPTQKEAQLLETLRGWSDGSQGITLRKSGYRLHIVDMQCYWIFIIETSR